MPPPTIQTSAVSAPREPSPLIRLSLASQYETLRPSSLLSILPVIRRAQTCERQRAETKPKISQCDVIITTEHQQIDNDPDEPHRNHVCKDAGLEKDADAGDDLDYADGQHEPVS